MAKAQSTTTSSPEEKPAEKPTSTNSTPTPADEAKAKKDSGAAVEVLECDLLSAERQSYRIKWRRGKHESVDHTSIVALRQRVNAFDGNTHGVAVAELALATAMLKAIRAAGGDIGDALGDSPAPTGDTDG